MARTTIEELRTNRLAAMSAEERAMFDATCEVTSLAVDVGEKVRNAREAAGLGQRQLAAHLGTSEAAVARLEAGDVGATLTTLQKVATALDVRIIIELSAAVGGSITDA
jgi:ribosome-binding protein aMBF1 (putative translation factor)